MRRIVLGLAAALAASACSPTWVSAVDMSPMYVRPAASPLAEGLYCPVMVSWRADNQIVSVAAGPRDSCVKYSWDSTRRLVIAEEFEGHDGEPPKRHEVALAALGDGLFIGQTANTDPEDKVLAPYVVETLLIVGAVFSYAEPLKEPARGQLIARHPRVTVLAPRESDELTFIRSGAREDIAALLRDASLLALSRPDENGNMTLALFTRVAAPGAQTVADVLARPDLAELRATALRLAAQAPGGISFEEEPSN